MTFFYPLVVFMVVICLIFVVKHHPVIIQIFPCHNGESNQSRNI